MTRCFNGPVTGPNFVAGIFVGGHSERMGGRPKGLLTHEGETLVARWVRVLVALGGAPVLVGHAVTYADVGIEVIADAEVDCGPLGGLVALLERARGGVAIAVACDMPYVSGALVRRLLDAPAAPAVAARRGWAWEPLFSRWDSSRALDVARARMGRRELGLQGLLDALGAATLDTGGRDAELDDWDRPEDVR